MTVPLYLHNLREGYRANNIVLPAMIILCALSAFCFALGMLGDLIVRVRSRDTTRYARSTMVEI